MAQFYQGEFEMILPIGGNVDMNKIVHSGRGSAQKNEETLRRALLSCLSKRAKTFV